MHILNFNALMTVKATHNYTRYGNHSNDKNPMFGLFA